jgi:hypothetical protein
MNKYSRKDLFIHSPAGAVNAVFGTPGFENMGWKPDIQRLYNWW